MTTPPAALVAALADRYTVVRELGRGGMATVYLAEDRKHERTVALKVLDRELAASLGADRFLREIRVVARLAHPHVLPLIDSGEAAGCLYYVTPHLPDGSLRDRLRREGRLAVGEVLRIVREVGAALDYAHRQGFVHRDVKPDNILFADGHAVLADFGIAQVCCAPGTEPLTEIGLALGTPEYMSPEQAAGETAITGASDLYALACVAFEMLAGEPPIRGDGPRATMARQVTAVPVPVRSLRPEVPAQVERALAQALTKDPAGRPANVTSFIEALTAPASDAAPVGDSDRTIAVLPFVNAAAEADTEFLSDGLTDELIDMLSRVDGLRVASRTSVFAHKGRASDVRGIGAMLGAGWIIEGTVRRSGARLRITAQLTSAADGRLLWSRRFDRTLDDVFAVQEEIARTIVDTLRQSAFADLVAAPAPRRAPEGAAHAAYLRGRYAWNKRSDAGMREAVEWFEKAIEADPAYARAYAGLADAYALQLDYRNMPASEGFERAKEYARRALALDETVAEAHASLAWSLFIHDWDWEASGKAFERAIALDPAYPTARQWHAFWLVAQSRLDEGVAEAEHARTLDPSSVSIQRSLGWVYYYARRFDEARRRLEQAVAMNPTADETYRVLALTLAHLGEWREAELAAREAVALVPGGSYNQAMLAYVLARAGRRDEALAVGAALHEAAREHYVSPIAFATIAIGLDDRAAALEAIERGRVERRGWLAYLRVHPIADPLRGEPGFAELMRAMRL